MNNWYLPIGQYTGFNFEYNGIDTISVKRNDYVLFSFDKKDLGNFIVTLNDIAEYIRNTKVRPYSSKEYYYETFNDAFKNGDISFNTLIKIHNDISSEPKFIKRTNKVVSDFYQYGKKSFDEFMCSINNACYDLLDIVDLLECDYVTIEKSEKSENSDILVSWYADSDVAVETLSEHIAKEIKDYGKEDFDKFCKKYNLDFKYYKDYLEDFGDDGSSENS